MLCIVVSLPTRSRFFGYPMLVLLCCRTRVVLSQLLRRDKRPRYQSSSPLLLLVPLHRCTVCVRARAASHHHTATAALLRCIWVILLVDWAPDGGNHEVACGVGVSNDAGDMLVRPNEQWWVGRGRVNTPLRGLGHRDTLALEILS